VSLTLAMLMAVSTTAPQENSRYEVMWRLRELESLWLESKPSARVGVVPFVEDARTAFATNEHPLCASLLDHARAALYGEAPDWIESVSIAFKRRLFDSGDLRANPTIFTMYPVDRSDWAEGCTFFGEIRPAAKPEADSVLWEGMTQVNSKAQQADAYLRIDRPGDVPCFVEIGDGSFQHHRRSLVLSVVERRDQRLGLLAKAIDIVPNGAPRLERGTARMLHGLLTSLARGSTEAHEYPGARLLSEAEQVIAAAAKKERWYGPERDGEYWLALPVGDSSVRARVFVPPGLTRRNPATLVIALHGQIFDEDTWFDGYGGGQAVELARKRGWMLVAPNCNWNEDPAVRIETIVYALMDAYPIHHRRVMLVGHSRGGGLALDAASAGLHFRAVATIGSAMAPSDAKSLVTRLKAPLYLAAGDKDFARADVEAFHKALVEAGSISASLKIHPHTEHWLAVTASLPDVFAWLDAQVK
jgi:hypothetical protein